MLKSILIKKDRGSSTWYLIYNGPSYIASGYFLHSITCSDATYTATLCNYEHTVKEVDDWPPLPVSLIVRFNKHDIFNLNSIETKILKFINSAFNFNFEFNSYDGVTVDNSTVYIPSYDFSRDEL